MELRYAENARYLILGLVGIVMSCLGYLTYLFTPIDAIVNSITDLRPGSLMYNLWLEPPLEILIDVHVFNVTNPKEFLAKKEKLRVEEIGPYTYQERLQNTEPIFNDNGTLTYKPIRSYTFRPDLSVGDPENTFLTIPNVPLLGMGSMISSYNMFVKLGFHTMTIGSKQFVNITPHDFLWGYRDDLVSLASTYLPHWIDFPTFGILDRMKNLDADNTVTIALKETEDEFGNLIRPYSISKFNGSPGMKQWNYKDVGPNETSEHNNQCNTIAGAFEPGLLPKMLPKNASISIYREAFCRPVSFNFEDTGTIKGGHAVYKYRVAQDFMQSGDENAENMCYCADGKCLPNGFTTLAPCYYGIPIVISQPHFYNADKRFLERIDGLEPDKEKHDATAAVIPELGLPFDGHIRVQVNLQVARNNLNKVKQFSDLMIPLLWIEMRAGETSFYVNTLLNLVLYAAPIAQTVIIWLFGILGISMVAVAALIIFYFPPHRRLEDPYAHRIGYSPILVIPLSSRFKDTRIS